MEGLKFSTIMFAAVGIFFFGLIVSLVFDLPSGLSIACFLNGCIWALFGGLVYYDEKINSK